MAYIEIETPEGTRRVPLERDRLSIGRLGFNDIVLPSAQISRQHAEVRRVNGLWQIADLHSTNGLQHNGQRIQEFMLSNGDQFLLAPGITVTFFDESAQPASPQPAAVASATSRPNWAQSFAQQPSSPQPAAQPQQSQPFRTSSSSPLFASASAPAPAAPTAGPVKSTPAVSPPAATFVPANSVAPLRPRSPFADDEVQFVPSGMAATPPPPQPPSGPAITPASIPVAMSTSMPGVSPTSAPPYTAGSARPTSQTPPMGYPAPLGPLTPGSDAHDLYHRSSGGPALQGRATSGPAAKLLHVCQTCGQLTAPDAVYCQNCHHTIAQECFNCRLSLLPIQDRCPRCHTPNVASVRRKHPHRTDG